MMSPLRPPMTWLLALAPALASAAVQTPADAPSSMRLRAAEIVDTPRASPHARTGPHVVFRIETDGPPACGGQPPGPSPAYVFLIDGDKSARTGAATRAFPELGIDAQVEVRCDAANGRYVSHAGDVGLRPAATAGAPHAIEVTVPVEALPSLDFYWIAAARDGRRYARLPGPGRYEAWRPIESWLH